MTLGIGGVDGCFHAGGIIQLLKKKQGGNARC
jgi:hypothetical protein